MQPYNLDYTRRMLSNLIYKHPGITYTKLWDHSYTWFPSREEFKGCLAKLKEDKVITEFADRFFYVPEDEREEF